MCKVARGIYFILFSKLLKVMNNSAKRHAPFFGNITQRQFLKSEGFGNCKRINLLIFLTHRSTNSGLTANRANKIAMHIYKLGLFQHFKLLARRIGSRTKSFVLGEYFRMNL